MSNFSALKTAIQNAIKQNGNEEITGDVLQQILLSIVSTMGDGAINTIEQNLTQETTDRQEADTQLHNAINAINTYLAKGYIFAGVATPTGTPVSGKVFYVATTAGTYTDFGNLQVQNGISILLVENGSWTLHQLLVVDFSLVQNSNNPVRGGAIYQAIQHEETERQAADTRLQKNINNEKSRAVGVENGLHQEIAAETDKRKQEIQGMRDDVLDLIHEYRPIEIEGNVVNAPDEEDITQQPNNLLKFKDKDYNPTIFSGLGRKYLRKNIIINEDYTSFDGFEMNPEADAMLEGQPDSIFWDRLRERFIAEKDGVYYLDWQGSGDYIPVSADKIYVNENIPYFWNGEDLVVDDDVIARYGNILTQEMMSDANIIYIIQYDFVLGEDITVPDNCVLEFDGGSISNGILIGNSTIILSDKVCFKDVVFKNNNIYKTSWFDGKFKESIYYASTGCTIYNDSEIEIGSNLTPSDTSIPNALYLPENCTLIGTDKGCIKIKGIKDYLSVPNIAYTDGVHVTDGCTIKNVTFYGEGSPEDMAEGYPIHAVAGSGSNIMIDGCRFYNFYALETSIIFLRKDPDVVNKNITFINNIVDGVGASGNGVPGDNTGGCSVFYVQNNYENITVAYNVFKDQIDPEDGNYVYINSTIVQQSGFPNETVNSVCRAHTNSVISHNTFINPTTRAIKTFTSSLTISDNSFIYTRNGLETTYAVCRGFIGCLQGDNIVISNNTVNTGNNEFYGRVLAINECKDVTINNFVASIANAKIASTPIVEITDSENVYADNVKVEYNNSTADVSGLVNENVGLLALLGDKNIVIRNSLFYASKTPMILYNYGNYYSIGDIKIENCRFKVDTILYKAVNLKTTGKVKIENTSVEVGSTQSVFSSVSDVNNYMCDSVYMDNYYSNTTLLIEQVDNSVTSKAKLVKCSTYKLSIRVNEIDIIDFTLNSESDVSSYGITTYNMVKKLNIDGLKNISNYDAIIDARNIDSTSLPVGDIRNIDVVLPNTYTRLFLNGVNTKLFRYGLIENSVSEITKGTFDKAPTYCDIGFRFFATDRGDAGKGAPIFATGDGNTPWVYADGTAVS